MNAEPGGLTVAIGDTQLDLAMTGGGSWRLPVGPATIIEGELEGSDVPAPAQLTNALGTVHDHLDDVIIEAPIVAAAPSVLFVGPHAEMLARVELGLDDVPAGYRLERADADEVFRTLVAEPRAERVHNPGLEPAHVDTIVATCCVVLAIVRRLDLQSAMIEPVERPTSTAADG